jgi:cephalosporin hydroxylase
MDERLRRVSNRFRHAYYRSGVWQDTFFRGRRILKPPTDLHAYHEVIWERRPTAIVECGTHEGGSALFFAAQFEAWDTGHVITIDLESCDLEHDRVTKLIGSSTDKTTIDAVRKLLLSVGQRVMAVLDSDHSPEHVAREMELYAALVTPGQYLVVEDTFQYEYNGRQNHLEREVVDPFLEKHPEFTRDARPERFGPTFHPGGWLLKGEDNHD